MGRFNKNQMERFSQHDIHEIYSQITQSLRCVECKAGILPHNIKISSIKEGKCLFDVNCHRCELEMSLSAQVEKTPQKNAMTHNRSSQVVHDNKVEEGVSEVDVLAIQNELRHFGGSFIRRFSHA